MLPRDVPSSTVPDTILSAACDAVEAPVEFVAILGDDGRFRYVSSSVERMLGYASEQLLGTLSIDLVHEADRRALRAAYARLVKEKKGTTIDLHLRLRHKDGSWRDVESSGHNLLHGRSEHGMTTTVRVVSTRRDVAKRGVSDALRTSELEVTILRGTEHRLREQFAKVPVPIFLWELRDADFVLVGVTDAAASLTEPFWHAVVGQTATDLFPSGWPARDLAIGCLLDGRIRHRSIAHEVAPGTVRTFDLTIGPQQPNRVLVYTVETTKHTRLATELRQAQRMEAVGQLAGGVAHDFNNLLTIISGHCQFLLESQSAEGMATTDARCEDARAIQEAAQRAAALTRQLLTFSRKQVFRATMLDLNAVVEQTRRFLGHLLGDDIEVVTTLEPKPCVIRADTGQVEQVLMNLILNARDAMPNGGLLSIATASTVIHSDAERFPDTVPPGSYVHLSVSDTGDGMPKETIARIFEPYFTTKDIDKGTGFGLSLVREIVTRAGGYIAVESEPGMGATFDVYLPRAAGEVTGGPPLAPCHRFSAT